MSEQPPRSRGGDDGVHWDPAQFTWDPYEARAEPRSAPGGAAGPASGDGGGRGDVERGASGAAPADPPALPPLLPGLEGVPSLDPSYDLAGVQKRSVPMVCQARRRACCHSLLWERMRPGHGQGSALCVR
jgi:hypothetical protein